MTSAISIARQPINLRRIEDRITVYVTSPCIDKAILRMFNDEKREAGLNAEKITLNTPEDPNDFPYNRFLGHAMGNRKDGYVIELLLSPRGLEDHSIHWSDAGYLINLSQTQLTRWIIRHELAHIKNGDCERVLPKPLKFIWNNLVEEPKANRYAWKGI